MVQLQQLKRKQQDTFRLKVRMDDFQIPTQFLTLPLVWRFGKSTGGPIINITKKAAIF